MDSKLLLIILKDIVAPEITSFVHSHYNKTGELPTEEEIKKALDDLSARIVMKGESLIAQIQSDLPKL